KAAMASGSQCLRAPRRRMPKTKCSRSSTSGPSCERGVRYAVSGFREGVAVLREGPADQIEPERLARPHPLGLEPAEDVRLLGGGVEDSVGRRAVEEVQADAVAVAEGEEAAATGAAGAGQRRVEPGDGLESQADQGELALVAAAQQQARPGFA